MNMTIKQGSTEKQVAVRPSMNLPINYYSINVIGIYHIKPHTRNAINKHLF